MHLDGYNQLPLLTGAGPAAREEIFYFTDDGDLAALRYGPWKIHFLIQENQGLRVWERRFTPLRMPMLFNLRSDPYERADEIRRLRRVAGGARLRLRSGAGLRRPLPGDLPRVPAAADPGQLQPGPGDGAAAEGRAGLSAGLRCARRRHSPRHRRQAAAQLCTRRHSPGPTCRTTDSYRSTGGRRAPQGAQAPRG